MTLQRMLLIALGLAVIALLALFALAYFSGESISAGLSRTDGQFITAGVFLGVFVVSLFSMKMLIKSSNKSKAVYFVLVLAGLLLWYEYESAEISGYFGY